LPLQPTISSCANDDMGDSVPLVKMNVRTPSFCRACGSRKSTFQVETATIQSALPFWSPYLHGKSWAEAPEAQHARLSAVQRGLASGVIAPLPKVVRLGERKPCFKKWNVHPMPPKHRLNSLWSTISGNDRVVQ